APARGAARPRGSGLRAAHGAAAAGARVTARLVLATRNRHKVEELRRILGEAALDVELVGLDEPSLPPSPEVAETEPTFAGNALLKARAVAAATGLPAV